MTSSTAKSSWVVAELAAVRLAVPVGTVLGAVSRPPVHSPLGRREGAVCQVIMYQGQAIPVLDLALWVDIGAPAPNHQAHQYVIVLRHGDRMVGVLVDAVVGVASLRVESVVRLHHNDSENEIFHSIAQDDSGAIPLSLLDMPRLMALTSIWSTDVQEGGTCTELAPKTEEDSAVANWAVFESGGRRLAVRAEEIDE